MAFLQLTVEGSRDAGRQLFTYFAIPAGRETDAGHDLLACLAEGAEVCLRNDLDEGGDGCTLFRRGPAGLVMTVGGHGWQSTWEAIDEAGVLSVVAELARLNRGGHWSTQGSITQNKN